MIDKDLFKLLGSNKKYIFSAVLIMVLGLISSISITASLCYILFIAFERTELNRLIVPIVVSVVALIVRFICTIVTNRIKDKLGREVKKDLRGKLYNKIVKLGEKNVGEINMAGLTQVSLEGVEQLDLYYSSYIPQFFYAMIAPLILFFTTVWIDWRVATVLICCVPLIPMSIIAVSKYAKKIFAKYWGKYISMGDGFLDSVQGLKELKIFKTDGLQHEKMNKNSEEFRKITMKVLVMQLASTTIMDLVAYGGAGLGILFALLGVTVWHVTSPFMGLFLILVAVDFFLPLRAFGSAFHVAMNGASAGKKIIEILNAKEPTWGEEKVNDLTISLDDVYFSYDQKRLVLNSVNMVFEKNKLTSIVGESGCGKSTVVKMILGEDAPQEGQVKVGDIPLNQISKVDYFNHVGVVSYNTYIFNTSIRDNFLLAKKDLTDEEIYASLKKVNLYEFIKENGGLDKVILEDANNISGGQKQRLALAISLASDKDIYIFDEATSNIDIDSETLIMKNVKELSKDKTVILISHRLGNVVPSDKIYFMNQGVVVEEGNHESLLKKNGEYAKLYQTQKSLEEGYMEVND